MHYLPLLLGMLISAGVMKDLIVTRWSLFYIAPAPLFLLLAIRFPIVTALLTMFYGIAYDIACQRHLLPHLWEVEVAIHGAIAASLLGVTFWLQRAFHERR